MPIVLAVRKGNLPIVKYITKSSIECYECKTNDGKTALHYGTLTKKYSIL